MTTSILEQGIKRWIEVVADLPNANVFKGFQSGPIPNSDYVTFTFLSGGGIKSYYIKNVKPDPNPTNVSKTFVSQRIRPVYTIDVYSDNGVDIIQDLWSSRVVPPIRSALATSGIVLFDQSMVRNLTNLDVTGYVSRFSVDFTFSGESVMDTEESLGYVNEIWDSFDIRGKWRKSATESMDVIIKDE